MSSEAPAQKLALELQMKSLQDKLASVEKLFPVLQELAKGSKELEEFVTDELTKYALSIRSSKLDKDQMEPFFRHPYHLYKDRKDKENEWHLAIPRFIDAQFGWLEQVTDSHNVFLINRYVDWLGELPAVLKKKIGMKDPLEVFLDGDVLVGKDVDKVADKYEQFVKAKDGQGRLVIDKEHHFELLAALIKDGILPFTPRPIPADLLVDRKCDFSLRDYQEEAWQELKRYSNIGAFFPPSTGKTFLGMYVCTHLKGPHLIAVPSNMLVEQWQERIELYTDLKVGVDVDVGTYQWCIKHGHKKQYTTLTIDEVHHMPANEFSKLAVIPRKITVGLSASPQREDDREEYIFALTGRPVGLAWDKFKQLGIIQSPPMHVWIVKDDKERISRLGELLAVEKKTIIFSDSLDMGAAVAKRFDIPHVFGETKDKLATVQSATVSVVSRVGDEGMSLPDIERVIEISWLFGSRRQELQRFTRLLHGKDTSKEGHIIMTAAEYQRDHKRLFSIMDHGFKIVLHREGMEEKVVDGSQSISPEPKRQARLRPARVLTPKLKQEVVKPNDFEMSHPMLSLPGVQKKLSTCTKAERLAIRTLYERHDKAMTSEEVWNLVGIGRQKDFVNWGKLIGLKLIKKVGKGSYQAI